MFDVQLAKAQIEHKEPIIVRFFFLQYAKLRMLNLYYNFFTKYGDVYNFEGLEVDIDSLYLSLAEKELEDRIRLEMKTEWERLRSKDCSDSFTADGSRNFILSNVLWQAQKNTKREKLDFSK